MHDGSRRRRAAGLLRGPAITPRRVLALVVLLGCLLRADGVDWDAGRHLHPDERYLSMVADNIRMPSSFGAYLSVKSPLNPYRTGPGAALVYGTFPISATKAVAHAVGRDHYDGLQLVGRRLSALVDTITILIVFGLARLLAAPLGTARARWAGVAGASAYALAPLAIQHAHFFVVDAWLTAAAAGALLAAAHALRATSEARRAGLIALAGALLGVALACKLSASLLAPGVVLLAIGAVRGRGPALVLAAAANLLLLAASAYLALRLAAPATFASDDWASPTLAKGLSDAIRAQAEAVAGRGGLPPPSLQWLSSTPVLSPLRTFGLISLGPAVALAAAGGIGLAGLRAVTQGRRREVAWLELAALYWTVAVGAYLMSRFGHTVRYLLPLVPVLCALAGVACVRLARLRRGGSAALASLAVLAAAWAFAYTAIYRAPHTRIVASQWIRAHTAPGDVVAGEEWDDLLPVPSDPELKLRQLAVYAPDDDAKLHALWQGLHGADLLVLSSARASGAIGRLPDRFPLTSAYYRELLAGQLGFRLAARFRSRPRLAGIEIPDEWAEETSWVYDHPEVRVLRATSALTWPEFRRRVLLSASGR